MRDCLVFDIETAPNDVWADPAFVAEIKAGLSAPSNYKDPEKIADYIEKAAEKERANAALSWCHGRVRAIGIGMLDSDEDPLAIASEDERQVLEWFAEQMAQLTAGTLLGGFNIRQFDVPFVSFRAAVHSIDLPFWWPGMRDWPRIVDPVDIFGRNGRLKDYLRALGLPPKLGDGADAPAMPLEELLAYVQQDVRVERLLIRRLQPRFAALREAASTIGSGLDTSEF